MIFSPPTSMAQAWKLQTEPRYWHQWFRHRATGGQSTDSRPGEPDGDHDGDDEGDQDPHSPHKHRNGLHPDWSMSLSPNGTVGDEMFPAKFSFDVNATPSCANDFVAFNTGVTPGAKDASATGDFSTAAATNGQTAIITNGGSSETLTASGAPATGTITVSSVPNAGDTVTVGSTTYTFDFAATGTVTVGSLPNAGDTVTVGSTTYKFVTTLVNANDVLIGGTTSTTAQNLRAAIDGNSNQCNGGGGCFGTGTAANASVTATVSTNVVTVTAITPGTTGNTIALVTVSGGRVTVSGATLTGGTGNFSNANEVLAVSGSTTSSAQNLRAAIDASSGQCSVSPCFGTGTTANASVTATRSGSVVTVTDKTYGTGGNSVTFTTASGGRLTLSPNTGTLSGGVNAVNTGTNFALDGNNTDAATNLAAAIIRNNAGVGVTATSSGTVVTVTATTAGSAGNNITLGGTLSNFWSSSTLISGVDAQPSIIAYNQLYSTQGSTGGLCNQNGPSVMWSYNTNPSGDTTGANVTSVVLSLDGKKVAYVETRTNPNGGSILHILQWKASQGTLTTPVAPDQIVTAWGSCTAGNSCIVNKTFGNAQPDSDSAPFYNYSNDTLYVGDDNGALHKFTPIFSGTPAEVTTGGWPITVHSGTLLSSPVFDGGSGNIYVTDAGGQLSYVREVGSTVGTCSSGSPPCLGSTNITLTGADLTDGPIVDSSAGRVFIFGNDSTNGGTVEQVSTALGGSVSVNVGGTGQGSPIHSGAFDNAYLGGSFTTGHIFVCGKNLTNNDHPAIHRIGFASSGVMNSTSDGNLNLVGSSGEECSPVTEILNGATDRIFFSVANSANQTGCTGNAGCIMSIDLGGTWPPTTVTHAVAASGGTSGIIVDNVSGSSQASNIYFTFLSNSTSGITCNGTANVGCAVKLTQSALQ